MCVCFRALSHHVVVRCHPHVRTHHESEDTRVLTTGSAYAHEGGFVHNAPNSDYNCCSAKLVEGDLKRVWVRVCLPTVLGWRGSMRVDVQ